MVDTNPDDSSRRPAHSQETTLAYRFLGSGPDPSQTASQVEIWREMSLAWNQGSHAPAEQWLARYPHIAANPEAAVQVVYEEVCLREERGEKVHSSEIYRRFPQWRDALRMLFDCHHLIQAEYPSPAFPEAGERLGELHLVRQLGRGALGHVFLARQASLSDRPLVVKLTPRVGDEHLSLARLQHTHIVPLYHVLDFPAQHLRALCMPYLGGTTWANVLSQFKGQPLDRRAGRDIVDALDAAESDAPVATSRGGPARTFLSRANYAQAVCWIGACVADALHHAHESGLVHLDIKPSNILLAGDGQPMLLDFHLAREVIPANSPPPVRLGGTRGYMSPEQQSAAEAVREGRPLAEGLFGRSDVYSLGAMLYESLTGRLPADDEAKSRANWREYAATRSRGLEDIVHKCLARNPTDRYADAARLATDLRRHLTDLPLLGVSNRSLRERWQKWRRRKPHSWPTIAAAIMVLTLVVGSLTLIAGDRVSSAESSLNRGIERIENADFGGAVDELERSWKAIRWMPGQGKLRATIETQLDIARRGRVAAAVHELVEQLRFLDSYSAVPPAQLKRLDAACHKLWAARDRVVPLADGGSPSEEQSTLRADLTDLVISWAGLRTKLHSSTTPATLRQETQQLFDEAESLCGSSFALDLARREYIEEPGQAIAAAPSLQARSGGDHYALGRYWFRADHLEQAAREFERAVALEPGVLWPYFSLAICAFRLQEFERALQAANVCVALSPESAACYYNRALCRRELGLSEQSLADLIRATQLDPTVSAAWRQRGVVHRTLAQFDESLSDFRHALKLGENPAEVYYEMALSELKRGSPREALSYLQQALNHDPADRAAAILKEKLESQVQ